MVGLSSFYVNVSFCNWRLVSLCTYQMSKANSHPKFSKKPTFCSILNPLTPKARLIRKGLAISNTLCPTKVFAHKALDMSYQQVEHSFDSINLCHSSPEGWSFGAWRIKGVIFSIWVTYFSNPTYSLFFSSIIFKYVKVGRVCGLKCHKPKSSSIRKPNSPRNIIPSIADL